jgi:hypothetical protein
MEICAVLPLIPSTPVSIFSGMATLAATGQQKFHEAYRPLMESFVYAQPNNAEELDKAISEDTAAVSVVAASVMALTR